MNVRKESDVTGPRLSHDYDQCPVKLNISSGSSWDRHRPCMLIPCSYVCDDMLSRFKDIACLQKIFMMCCFGEMYFRVVRFLFEYSSQV